MNTPTDVATVPLAAIFLLCPMNAQAREAESGATNKSAANAVEASKRNHKTQKELAVLHRAKIAETWLSNADWIEDLDDARAAAKATGRKIFVYFTRSYAP